MICLDLEKGKLTFSEAWRNFKEMHTILETDHKPEVQQLIIDKLVEERKRRKTQNETNKTTT
jgi:quinol monooxygenase YgiN